MQQSDVLDAAMAAVKERGEAYGDVTENFQRIADHWNVWLAQRGLLAPGQRLGPEDVAVLNMQQKFARLIESPGHADSVIDIAGYAACYGAVACR